MYADWYNTAEAKKKKKKQQTIDQHDIEDFEITLEDEMEEASYDTVSSFLEVLPHEPAEKSAQVYHVGNKRLPVNEERQASPKSRTSNHPHSKSRTTSHSRSSSHLSRDSDSMSVSPTPTSRSSYRDHGSHVSSRDHHTRTPSWSPTRHSIRSTSSQDSSPIRERKQDRYLDSAASLNDDKRSTRSSASIADRMKYKRSYHARSKSEMINLALHH